MDPQVTGVVIISLPPPGDPSKGKTITAFVLSDDPEDRRLQPPPLWVAAPPPDSPPWPRRAVRIRVLGAFMAILALWACIYSEGPAELLRKPGEEEDREREGGSLVFPLIVKEGGPRFLDEEDLNFSRKVRLLSLNSSAVLPISGNIIPDGIYYTSIRVGNPGREYLVDVDTASELTWIQCDAPCQSCAKGPNPLYRPAKENLVPAEHSLCQELQRHHWAAAPPFDPPGQCDYEIAYADHSSSMGVLATDYLHLDFGEANKVNPAFVFGCAYDQRGQLSASPAKTDGILGLTDSHVSFPSQLAKQGLIANVIGHCMKPGRSGGHLFLGVDFVPRRGMTWVPMVDSPSYYEVLVKRLTFGSRVIGKTGRKSLERAIFDTGSTYTYFPGEAYADLLASVNAIGLERDPTDKTLPVCWRAGSQIRTAKDARQFFPTLTFHFENKWWVTRRVLRIQPEGYLTVNGRGNVCLGILDGTEVNGGSAAIIGDISLRGLLVVYDNVEKQVGWVQSDCRKLHNSVDFPILL